MKHVNADPIDEQMVIHHFVTVGRGGVTVEARCIGEVEVEGKRYSFDRVVKFRARKAPARQESGR